MASREVRRRERQLAALRVARLTAIRVPCPRKFADGPLAFSSNPLVPSSWDSTGFAGAEAPASRPEAPPGASAKSSAGSPAVGAAVRLMPNSANIWSFSRTRSDV